MSGVDIARNVVAAGNARAKAQGPTNCSFREGDASYLQDIDDHSFDLVVKTFGAMFAPRPPPEGFVSPMTWGTGNNVIERFSAAGVPAVQVSFARDAFTFRSPGTPASLVANFRDYSGPTMNALAAADQGGKSADLQRELEALFESEIRSETQGATSIRATFLKGTVTV